MDNDGRGALLTLFGLVGMIDLQVLGYFLGRLFLREIR
jgi:hypothetical protein